MVGLPVNRQIVYMMASAGAWEEKLLKATQIMIVIAKKKLEKAMR